MDFNFVLIFSNDAHVCRHLTPRFFCLSNSRVKTLLSQIEPLHSMLEDVLSHLVTAGIFLTAMSIPLIVNSRII